MWSAAVSMLGVEDSRASLKAGLRSHETVLRVAVGLVLRKARNDGGAAELGSEQVVLFNAAWRIVMAHLGGVASAEIDAPLEEIWALV